MRDPVSGAVTPSGLARRERLRWGASLMAAFLAHAGVVMLIAAMARPAAQSASAIIDVEIVAPPRVAVPPDDPVRPRPADMAEARPVPPPPDAAAPPEADAPPPQPTEISEPLSQEDSPASRQEAVGPTPPQATLPIQNNGFAMTPSPTPATDPSPDVTASASDPASPIQDRGFAVTPGPIPAIPPPARTSTRLAPLVVRSNSQHDARLPDYPADAHRKGEQGDVLIEIEIDPAGAIKSARVMQSSGSTSLDDAALRSVRALRFRPPKPPAGVVLRHAILVEIPFSFRLQ